MVTPTELEMFWPDFAAKALLLVTPTEQEIFWPGFAAKALLLVTPTELEIYFVGKALVLVNPDPSPREAFNNVKPLPNSKFF